MTMTLKRLALPGAILLTLLATAPLQAEPLADETLTRGEKGHFLTEMMINQQGPYTVLIDTGASNTILMQPLIEELALSPVGSNSHTAQTASGSVPISFYALDSLGIAGLELGRLRAVGATGANPTLNNDGVEAIIGLDILRNYLLEFDQSANRFRLHDQDADLSARLAGWTEIPMRRGMAGLSFTDIAVNGAVIPAVFDTGASRNIINMSAAGAAGYGHGDPRASMDEPVIGFGGQATPAFKVEGADLGWSDLRLEGQTVTIAQAPIFDILRMSGGPAMIAGAPMFANRSFIVDFARMTIWISPAD